MAESDVTTFGQRIEVVGRPGSGGMEVEKSGTRGRHVDVGMTRHDTGRGVWVAPQNRTGSGEHATAPETLTNCIGPCPVPSMEV